MIFGINLAVFPGLNYWISEETQLIKNYKLIKNYRIIEKKYRKEVASFQEWGFVFRKLGFYPGFWNNWGVVPFWDFGGVGV